MTITHHIFKSTLGPLIVAWRGSDICFVHFGDSESHVRTLLSETFPSCELLPSPCEWSPQTALVGELITLLINGETGPAHAQVPLRQHGTPFQQKVWEHIQSIPIGEVRSYQAVAQAIGLPRATRAVAAACSRNNIALLIPCHRVVRTDGTLGGYRWGMLRKHALLESERSSRGPAASYHGINVTGDIGETVWSGGR